MKELSAPGNIGKRARQATAWVEAAIAAVKNAPGENPYRAMSDEDVAGALLKEIENKKRS